MPIGGIIAIAIVAVIIVLLIIANIKVVTQTQAFVIERLGSYSATWKTGLHFKVPFVEKVAR